VLYKPWYNNLNGDNMTDRKKAKTDKHTRLMSRMYGRYRFKDASIRSLSAANGIPQRTIRDFIEKVDRAIEAVIRKEISGTYASNKLKIGHCNFMRWVNYTKKKNEQLKAWGVCNEETLLKVQPQDIPRTKVQTLKPKVSIEQRLRKYIRLQTRQMKIQMNYIGSLEERLNKYETVFRGPAKDMSKVRS